MLSWSVWREVGAKRLPRMRLPNEPASLLCPSPAARPYTEGCRSGLTGPTQNRDSLSGHGSSNLPPSDF